MNPLLFLAGGGVAAYLLRHKIAAALTKADGAPASTPPVAPPTSAPTSGASSPAAYGPARWLAALSAPHTAPQPEVARSSPPPAPTLAHPLTGHWVWPVPRYQGRAPVISDGFGSPRGNSKHAGVDIMFQRLASDEFKAGTPNGSPGFVMPDAWSALAAADGMLWSSGKTDRGYAVAIDHGHVVTFYTHLETLFVPEVKPPIGAPTDQRVRVKAGQPIGMIGYDPQDPQRLKHLHFELWVGGPETAIDPRPLMGAWQVLTMADVEPFMADWLPRNAKAKPRTSDLVHVVEYWRAYPGERQR